MQISMWVAFDEKQMRRSLSFIMKPRMRRVRILGGVVVGLSALILALDPASVAGYVFALLGLFFVFGLGPVTVARSVRLQSNVIKEGLHMTLDNEAITVTYPLVESRFKWAGLGRVVETPEVWYVMFGRVQAITIPKGPMTEPQRAEFAEFVKTLEPAQ